MELVAVVLITATIFVWGTVCARLERADIYAPIAFTLVGGLLAIGGLVDTPSESVALKPLVEITLVWVLFSDAARIRVQDFRQGMGLYGPEPGEPVPDLPIRGLPRRLEKRRPSPNPR